MTDRSNHQGRNNPFHPASHAIAVAGHQKTIAVSDNIMAERHQLTPEAVASAAVAAWDDFTGMDHITQAQVADVLSRVALLVPAQTAANLAAEEWGTENMTVHLSGGRIIHWCGEHEILRATYTADRQVLVLVMEANTTLERLS